MVRYCSFMCELFCKIYNSLAFHCCLYIQKNRLRFVVYITQHRSEKMYSLKLEQLCKYLIIFHTVEDDMLIRNQFMKDKILKNLVTLHLSFK